MLVSDDDFGNDVPKNDFPGTAERVRNSTNTLGFSAASFAKAMTKAFADATVGGKQFDDVLKQLALRLSGMTVSQAFQPLAKGIAGSLGKLIGGIFGDDSDSGGKSQGRAPPGTVIMNAVSGLTPFASGGVVAAPTYFPLPSGGLGLAGEAGSEAILPLARGSDGRLGVAMTGMGQAPSITVQIATPDTDGFRRSEAYITGQIARAVARGQRGF